LTWIGAKVFQAGRIAEKVLSPFVYVTPDRILAAYLHAANGVDDGSGRRGLRRGAFGGVVLALSLLPHRDSALRYFWSSPPLQIPALSPLGERVPRWRFLQPVSRRRRVRGSNTWPKSACRAHLAIERIGQSPRALYHLPLPTAFCPLPTAFSFPPRIKNTSLSRSQQGPRGLGGGPEID
jgi:hypothetical protein